MMERGKLEGHSLQGKDGYPVLCRKQVKWEDGASLPLMSFSRSKTTNAYPRWGLRFLLPFS